MCHEIVTLTQLVVMNQESREKGRTMSVDNSITRLERKEQTVLGADERTGGSEPKER